MYVYIYNYLHYMGVSENSRTPKSSILIGFSIINHPFWGTPIFGKTHMNIQVWSFFFHKHGSTDQSIFAEHREAQARFWSVIHLSPGDVTAMSKGSEIQSLKLVGEWFAGWWLNQPIWKIFSSKLESSLNRGENKKYLKPPPSLFHHKYCEKL